MIQSRILGAIIVNNSLFIEFNNELNENYFTNENKKIFNAIEKLILNAYDASMDSIITTCESSGINYDLLTNIVNCGLDCLDFPFEISRLKDDYTNRILCELNIGLSARITNNVEVSEIISYIDSEIGKIGLVEDRQESIPEIINKINRRIESTVSGKLSGVDTGFRNMNEVTNGWQNGELVIIAGRPAMGKTAFVTSAISNMAANGIKCVLFSLEMSSEQMVTRLLSLNNVPLYEIKSGEIRNQLNYQKSKAIVSELDLLIFDKIYKLKSIILKVKELKLQGRCDVVVIDYMQLIVHSQSGRNRENEVSEISRSLKLLAKELEIPIICLSQLSRNVEGRKGNVPKLSDLRESGAIEQDADIIGFLYRPEYYEIEQDENGNSTKNKAFLLIEKNRNGALKNLEYNFYGEYAKFTENKGIQGDSEVFF